MATTQQINWWRLDARSGSQGILTRDGDALRADILKASGMPADVQLYQFHFAVEQGRRYHMHFMAKADRDLVISLSATSNCGDYHNQGLTRKVPLVSQWIPYDYEFKAEKADGIQDRIPNFALGGAVGTLWIKDITVEED